MNHYTDAPPLHPNPVLANLQVLAWIFLHPAAWRSQVQRIAPDLPANFALADLTWAQWQHPFIRQLLLGYGVWSLGVLLVTSGLWVNPAQSPVSVVVWVGTGLALGVQWLLSALARRGAARGRAAAILARGDVCYAVWGLCFVGLFTLAWGLDAPATARVGLGLFWGLVFGLAASWAVAAAASVALGVVIFVVAGMMASIAFTLAANNFVFTTWLFIVTAGLTGSIAGVLPGRQAHYPRSRQVLGVAVGVIIGGGVLVIAAGLSMGVAVVLTQQQLLSAKLLNTIVVSLTGATVGAVTLGARHRARWRVGAVLAGSVGLVVGGGSIVLGQSVEHLSKALTSSIWMSLLLAAMFALPYVLAERVGGAWAGAIAGALSGGAVGFALIQAGVIDFWLWLSGLMVPFALGAHLLLAVGLYPALLLWNLTLLRLDERRAHPGLLRWHSVFWHEHQPLPLVGLDEHLVLMVERNPVAGRAALDYVLGTRQRWAAQAAQVELDARRLEHCADVPAVSAVHRTLGAGELAGPAAALLRSLSRLSQDMQAALHQESAYNQRLALSAVEDRLDGLLRELTRSSERYAARFRPIAVRWRALVAAHIQALAATVEQRQEIDSPYVIGVPLTDQQEIFVGRTDISAHIEQLLLDRRRPPLLLYGQRRMGKTSLLNNLGRLLPSTIVPLFVDLQGPASRATDHAGFLYNLARGMGDSAQRQRQKTLPPLPRAALTADPFTRFDEWLDEVEQALGAQTALLALDEFEVLEAALSEGRFNEAAVLGMLRHLIQHRPRFKVLLAGSHTLVEVQRWASYLINVQVVQIGYLTVAEARQLIEHPVQDFALRYTPEATTRALALTRGHPFLTQLLGAEIVALKNEQPPATRRLATQADVEAAVPAALEHGSFFFADIAHNQVDAAARPVLHHLAAHGEGAALPAEALAAHCPGDFPAALALLTRRDLLEPHAAGYRFQVELMRQWFAQPARH